MCANWSGNALNQIENAIWNALCGASLIWPNINCTGNEHILILIEYLSVYGKKERLRKGLK